MNYNTLKTQHSKELNDFPMAFAFSNEQFAEGLEKLGITKDEALSIPGNGFIRKTDGEAFTELFRRHNQEMAEALTHDDFMVQAIEYELGNHEYCITYNPEPALDALGLSLKNERVARLFKVARESYESNVIDW